jgi:hypothetical protein
VVVGKDSPGAIVQRQRQHSRACLGYRFHGSRPGPTTNKVVEPGILAVKMRLLILCSSWYAWAVSERSFERKHYEEMVFRCDIHQYLDATNDGESSLIRRPSIVIGALCTETMHPWKAEDISASAGLCNEQIPSSTTARPDRIFVPQTRPQAVSAVDTGRALLLQHRMKSSAK